MWSRLLVQIEERNCLTSPTTSQEIACEDRVRSLDISRYPTRASSQFLRLLSRPHSGEAQARKIQSRNSRPRKESEKAKWADYHGLTAKSVEIKSDEDKPANHVERSA